MAVPASSAERRQADTTVNRSRLALAALAALCRVGASAAWTLDLAKPFGIVPSDYGLLILGQ